MGTLTTNLFECLYFLESPELYLLEIKRNDLNEYAAIAEKYQWLRIDKSSLEISRLSFRSMDSSKDVEERFFEEGFLKFNSTTGTFIEKYNSAQHSLENISRQEIPSKVLDSIYNMLSKNKTNP
ncbi:MAG: hypothetical protein EOP00_32650 [Pedobacter sp.]|nr:MAG: hypothetical protein EOP00_32650 [Pedobacter sp.]